MLRTLRRHFWVSFGSLQFSYILYVQWAAHQPTPNCQIYLINFQLYCDAIRFKFYCEILTYWGRLMCCPLYIILFKQHQAIFSIESIWNILFSVYNYFYIVIYFTFSFQSLLSLDKTCCFNLNGKYY